MIFSSVISNTEFSWKEGSFGSSESEDGASGLSYGKRTNLVGSWGTSSSRTVVCFLNSSSFFNIVVS